MSLEHQCEELFLAQATRTAHELAASRGIEVLDVRRGGAESDPTVEVLVLLQTAAGRQEAGFLTHIWYGDDHDGCLDEPDGVEPANAEQFVTSWTQMAFRPRTEAAFDELQRLAATGRLAGSLPMLEYGVAGGEHGPLLRQHPAR